MDNLNLIVVKCPKCGLKLSFKPVPNYRQKPVTCPKCHFVDIAGKFIIENDPAQRPSSNAADTVAPNNDKTKIVDKPLVSLKCLETGEKKYLELGPNTIGRKASNSKAKILFTDTDCYMSRLHSTITVATSPVGVQIQLKDENSANGTFVKGIRVPEKSVVKILPGDPFKMGQLNFVCEVSNQPAVKTPGYYDDENTTL